MILLGKVGEKLLKDVVPEGAPQDPSFALMGSCGMRIG